MRASLGGGAFTGPRQIYDMPWDRGGISELLPTDRLPLILAVLSALRPWLRWQHPTRGLIGPEEFILVAEETGLIRELGWWESARGLPAA